MIKQIENRRTFQCALGQFVFEFAKLEFSLLYYWGIIDNPRNQNLVIAKKVGTDFEERRKKVTGFINETMPSLKTRWDKINNKLGDINLKRRYLIHGIGNVNFTNDAVSAIIKHKHELKLKEFTIADIKLISDEIAHLLTGTDGLTGQFLIDFSTQRFNLYNAHTSENKIVYTVDGKILTDFQG